MPQFAPARPGNGRHAYVRAANAATYPLVVTAATNDQIEFGEAEFIIPPNADGYATPQELVDALNVATNDEDNAGPLLSTLVVFEVSRSDPTKIKATSIAAGAVTSAFGTGAEHDGLAAIGFTDAQALADGDPLD